MELLDAIRQDVLKQKGEEAVNFFSKVADFREFISATSPASDVSVTVKMCCLSSERLRGNNGTPRVTVIDASQHGVFDQTQEALYDLTVGKRKPYIAQITDWDAMGKNGTTSKPNMKFRSGALYEFRLVDGVGFYADVPMGRVQFENDNGKIVELRPPSRKRKVMPESGEKKGKAKMKARKTIHDTESDEDVDADEDGDGDNDDIDVAMETEATVGDAVVSVRTRSNTVVHV